MGKTIAQKGANGVKDGIRHKDVYAIAVGDITKAFFFSCGKKLVVSVTGGGFSALITTEPSAGLFGFAE